MAKMKPEFIGGFVVAVLVLAGIWAYAQKGTVPADEGSTPTSEVQRFTDAMRAKVIAESGHPIEGYEPFMFMQVYPGLTPQDFNGVDALIGGYTVNANGEVVWDAQGEQELHTAARAISDEGMAQLYANILARVSLMAGSDPVEGVMGAISAGESPDAPLPPHGGISSATFSGTIECLPKKGPGPHTMECAFGLKSDNGLYYGLKNLWEVAPELNDTQIRVRVTGELEQPQAGTSYDIQAVIVVEKAERL